MQDLNRSDTRTKGGTYKGKGPHARSLEYNVLKYESPRVFSMKTTKLEVEKLKTCPLRGDKVEVGPQRRPKFRSNKNFISQDYGM
jgi:hypothetical protein